MSGVETPVFIRLGNRGRGLLTPVPGSIQNVSIRNVVARNASMASSITGQPGYPVRDVVLDGIVLGMEGGAGKVRTDVPELPEKYPEGRMFGELPAYGLYARHVEGLTLIGVQPRTSREDARPAAIFDDVRKLAVFASPGIQPQ
jgi:hypothetical protein